MDKQMSNILRRDVLPKPLCKI